MGKHGIAEEWYENMCLKPIIQNNEIDSSVHFLGVLGAEKWEIMNNSKVGIVNTTSWETFGYTMVEMQMAGMMIVSKKSPGLLDTMYPQSGILYDNSDQLANCIVELLKNEDYESSNAICYINDNFSYSKNVTKWKQLFNNLYFNTYIVSDNFQIPDFKYIRYAKVNRKLQQYLPFLPSLNYYRDIYIYSQKVLSTLSNRQKTMKILNYVFIHIKAKFIKVIKSI